MVHSMRRAVIGLVALAAALIGGAAPAEPFLPAPGAPCPRCAALIVSDGGAGAAALARIATALEGRGVALTLLERPPPHALIHAVREMLAGPGRDAGARLLIVLAGRVEPVNGQALFTAAPPGRLTAEGVPGLALAPLFDDLGGLAARTALILDAALPAGLPVALAPEGEGAGPFLAVGRGDAALAGTMETALNRSVGLALSDLAAALAGKARVGWLRVVRTEPSGLPEMSGGLIGSGASPFALPGIGDLALPAPPAPPDASGAADRCARLATDPAERAGGTDLAAIDAAAAARACLGALLAAPGEALLAHRYARALEAGGNAARARHFYERAERTGHAPAGLALGRLDLAEALAARDRPEAAEFDAAMRRGLDRIERAAEAGLAAAALFYRDLAADPGLSARYRLGPEARVAGLLRRAARASPEAALALADLIAARPDPGERALREALGLYEQAAAADVPGARAGLDAVRATLDARLRDRAAEKRLADCDRLLRFEVMAVETTVDLAADLSSGEAASVKARRIDTVLRRTDLAAAIRACEIAMADADAPADLVARYAALLRWIAGQNLSASLPETGDWIALARRAADAGDPAGLYLEGFVRMGLAYRHRDGRPDLAREMAEAAIERYGAAHRAGVAQAGYLLATMHLQPVWSRVGFVKRPFEAVRILEELQARAPRARRLLIDVYRGADGYAHLDAVHDPRRARELELTQ